MSIQSPKGTFDILPYGADEPWKLSHLWQYLEKIICSTASDYGYSEIRTPIYERTELFCRGVGDSSDIVMKEMFTFLDRGERSISLRPEGTASVMRAFLEHKLAEGRGVQKFFYLGPMFRYERPQSGRYRQFHQFGIEAIGCAHPAQDAETIDLLWEICRRLGLKGLKLHLNSVGDAGSRQAYREALQNFLRPHFESLSQDSKTRFEKNPLRILDSKDPGDKKILEGAPSILSSLSPDAKEHFDEVRRLLDQVAIPYEINDRIVRGLDYYTKTVFEITADVLGAQNALGGGGRFDGLIGSLGGPDLPAVGFAGGIERLIQTMLAQNAPFPEQPRPLLYLLPLGEEARRACFSLAAAGRRKGVFVEIDLHAKKVGAGLQAASKLQARFCAIIGSEEIAKGLSQLKELSTRQQIEVPLDRLIDFCLEQKK